MKGHITSEYKKRAQHRLKIIQGQVLGLKKMAEGEAYCIDILHQSLAIQESLKSFDGLMLENHLTTHAAEKLTGKNRGKGIAEMLKLYKLRNK